MWAWFITFISGTFFGLIEWLVKKVGVHKLLIAFQISINAVLITFITTAIVYLSAFLFSMWELVKDVAGFFSNVPTVVGNSYGVENQDLVSSFFGLLQESGLASAFETSGNLLIGLLSVYFVIQAYKIYLFALTHVHSIITSLLNLMNR